MPAKSSRVVPDGYVKTSFEIAQSSKTSLERLKLDLREDGQLGASEAAIVEALILAARKRGAAGVDATILAKVLKARKAAQERE